MNNPLKYIDPSGNIVEIGGVDVRVTRGAAMYIAFLPPDIADSVVDVVESPEYQAYEAFREQSSWDPLRAQTLEQSERVVTIAFDDLGYQQKATTNHVGDNYEIVLNNNMYNDLSKAEDWFVGIEINMQVEDHILRCYPSISLPNPIELIPVIGTVYSLVNAAQQYNSGQMIFSDALLYADAALIGWYNYPAGLFASGLMTIFNFAQCSRTFYQLAEIYGYPFR